MNLDEAMTCLWLVKSHWSNFAVLAGEKLALQAGAWLDVLGDVALSDVRAALAEIDVDGGEFAPTPGQVRQVVFRRRGLAAPDVDQALAEVAGLYRRGISRAGESGPKPSHPAISEAIKALGGWREAGQMDIEKMRTAFRYAYDAAAKRADREAMTPPAVRNDEASGRLPEAVVLPDLALPTGDVR